MQTVELELTLLTFSLALRADVGGRALSGPLVATPIDVRFRSMTGSTASNRATKATRSS